MYAVHAGAGAGKKERKPHKDQASLYKYNWPFPIPPLSEEPANLFTTMGYHAQHMHKSRKLKELTQTREEEEADRMKKNESAKLYQRAKREKEREEAAELKAKEAAEAKERQEAAIETARMVVEVDLRHRVLRGLVPRRNVSPVTTRSASRDASPTSPSVPSAAPSPSTADTKATGVSETASPERTPATDLPIMDDATVAVAHAELIAAGLTPAEDLDTLVVQLISVIRHVKEMAANQSVNSAMHILRQLQREERYGHDYFPGFYTPPGSDSDHSETEMKTATAATAGSRVCVVEQRQLSLRMCM